MEETRTRSAGRTRRVVGATGAALASGLIEGDLTVALDRGPRTRSGAGAARAALDLRCRRIDGYMDDPENRSARPRGGAAMTRVCLYLRISTDEDHQPTSLRTQHERLERYCEAMEDWRIVAAHEDQASAPASTGPACNKRSTWPGNSASTCYSSTASTASHARSVSSQGCARNSTNSTSF